MKHVGFAFSLLLTVVSAFLGQAYGQCSSVTTISTSSCGSTFTKTFTAGSSWTPSSLSGCSSSGTTRGEGTWRYTPAYSGPYPIYVASVSGSTSSPQYNVYMREGSSCSSSGWSCVGNRTSASTSSPAGTVFLEAGVTYHFAIDWRQSNSPSGSITVGIRIGCYTPPNPCSGTPPTLSICSGSTTSRSFNGYSGNSSYDSYCSGYGDGQEFVYKFRTGAAGNYIVNVTSTSGSGNRDVAYKFKKGTSCSSSSWTCAGARGSSGTITMSNLSANSDYLLMLDAESDEGNSFSHTFRIDCPDPCGSVSTISSCGSTKSVSLAGPGFWSNSCPFSTPGAENVFKFTPTTTGTHYLRLTSASGGALSYYIKNSSFCSSSSWTCLGDASTSGSTFALNLTAYSTVHILVDNSSTSTSARNHTFTIDCPYDPCTNISSISCGTSTYLPLSAGPGAGWNITSCSSLQTPGREKIYSFTPSISGNYDLNVTSALGTIRYFYKDASLGCDEYNWNCVGSTFSPNSFTMNLTAGTQYYILADGASASSSAYHYFTVECTDPCQSYTNIPSCGFSTAANMNASSGAGWNIQCGSHNGWGKERIFSFTPQQTDNYSIQVTAATGAASYYYRTQSSGCSNVGWTCIDAMPSTGTTQTIALTAGTSYLFLVDAEDSTQYTSQSFEINCPPHNPCNVIIPTIQCGSVISQIYPNGSGNGWQVGDCGSAGLGYEYLFDFAPTVSGDYDIISLNSTPLQVSYYYRTYSSTCDTTGYLCVGVLQGPGLAGTVSLTANTTYTFLLVNDSLPGGRVDFEIQGHNFPYPTGFTAQNPGCDSMDLSWQAVSGAIGYNLDVADDSLFTNITGIYNDLPIGNITSYTVQNLSAGTPYFFRVRAEFPCGFGSDTTIQMNTIGAPINLVASSNSPLCVGSTPQLSLSATSLSPGPYNWAGPNGFTSNQQNETLSPVTTSLAGLYTVTVVTVCGAIESVVTVDVSPDPNGVSVSSNSPACVNGTINLSATALTGASYSWVGPNGFTSAIQNPVITNAQSMDSGIYTLTVSATGCSPGVITTSVSVQTSLSVTASSNSPLCDGGSSPLNLSTSTIPGGSYLWTGPNGFSSTLQNPVINSINNTHGGYYYLSVVGSCGSGSDSVLVSINSPITNPQASNNGPVCSGAQLNLSASTHSGASYFWEGPGGYTSNSQFAIRNGVTSSEAGIYTLTLSDPVCGVVSTSTSVSVLSSPSASASSNSPVCSGGVIYLNATTVSGSTYSWAGPNGYSSTTQNPSITQVTTTRSGDYTLTVSSVGCGSSVAVVSVQVGAQLSNILASSPSPICQGNNLILNSTNISGPTYDWSGPSGFTSSQAIDTIPNAGSANAGVYTLIVSSPGCGSITRTVPVSVNAVPVPNAGSNSPICAGSALQFSCNTSPGASYLWQGPSGYNSTSSSPAISNAQPIRSGDYTLTMTIPNCGSYTSVASVIVSGNTGSVVANSNSPICTGQNLQLSATTLAQAVYDWSGPNGFTSSSQNPVINNAQTSETGSYTLIVSSPGCASTTRVHNVSVLNALVASPGSNAPICTGSSLSLTANSYPNSTYSWVGPNGFASSLQNPSISNAQTVHAGDYTLTISSQACGTSSATTSVSVSTGLTNVSALGNSPVCTGSTLNLTGSTHSGANYLWVGPNGFTSNSQSPSLNSVTTAEAGNYIMTVSLPGCGSVSRTVTVVVSTSPSFTPGSNSPLCSGGALYLTTNSVAGASYLWNGPNGYSSTLQNPSIINAQPVQSGDYSLTVTINGCVSSQQTITATISANPSAATATANTPVCSGGNLQLSATIYTGAVYSWTGPNGFTSNLAQPTINGVTTAAAGNYIVQIVSGSCPSVTRSRSVVVNATPVVTPGSNSPVCQGNSISLTTPAVSGATYSWTGPASFASSVQNPSISNAQITRTGIYTLIVNSSNCGVFSGTTSVVVGQSVNNISISTNSPACVGGNLNLTGTLNTTASYSWTGPSGFTANTQTATISNITTGNAGIYVLVATAPGCGTKTVSFNARVNNPAAVVASISNPVVCTGSAVYFNGTAPSGSTYSWAGPVGFASSAQNPSRSNVQLSHSGVYTLSSNVPGCGLIQAFTTLTVNPCRVTTVEGEVAADELEVYPNPFSEYVNVKSPTHTISKAELLDVSGKVIRSFTTGTESNEAKFFVGELASGTYLLRIYTSQGPVLRKIVKQ